jgi:predicted lipoprotein with Yx(FWY)xxD motif
MSRLLVVPLLALVLLLASCGDDDSGEAEPAAESAASSDESGGESDDDAGSAGADRQKPAEKPAKPGSEITIAGSQFGEIIFDGDNQAIYLFDRETASKPECYGACAEAWPPVLSKGEPVATGGANSKLLGTTKRDDGTTQVTYAGQPLYYYAHENPGQVLCHNVSEFGGLWLVLDANGDALS